ncbi:MAG: GNAT family N-acetyltransferase [Candidatus Binatia bacterium]
MDDEKITIVKVSDAAFFIEDLFRRTFAQPSPTTPVHYVAFCKPTPSTFKAVGYYHVDHRDEYALVGGLCVDTQYRNRGLGEEFSRIVFAEAADKKAFFAYIGNPISQAIARRVGYIETRQQYLMVKWVKPLSEDEKERIITEVIAIGPF